MRIRVKPDRTVNSGCKEPLQGVVGIAHELDVIAYEVIGVTPRGHQS
jgi:hypothetical protein